MAEGELSSCLPPPHPSLSLCPLTICPYHLALGILSLAILHKHPLAWLISYIFKFSFPLPPFNPECQPGAFSPFLALVDFHGLFCFVLLLWGAGVPSALTYLRCYTQFRLVLLAYKILDEVTSLLVYFQSFIHCMPE